MRRHFAAYVLTAALFVPGPAMAQTPQLPERVQARTAAEALQILLDANIEPAGPLRGDGALIAGLLAAQGLTFPVSSSSGAFATRLLDVFSPAPIAVSASGSFGPLFAERGRTNGQGNISASLTLQRIAWGTLDDSKFGDYDLVSRRIYRNNHENGPAGTVDDFQADVKFTSDILLLAATYGVREWLDVGVSVPFIQSRVVGTKRLERTRPQAGSETIHSQTVSGTSSGVGDVVLRAKMNVFPLPAILTPGSANTNATRSSRTHVAIGLDWRLPTGATADLYFDCRAAPCSGADPQAVPDLGLGSRTAKLSGFGSIEIGRLSPHLNLGYTWVPAYECGRGGPTRYCKGALFEVDALNNTQDAKDQRLSDEWLAVVGTDYQLVPYRATVSFDVIGRQIIRGGQFRKNRSRLIYRADEGPETSVVSEVESRHGNANPVVAALGGKISVASRWVVAGHVLFPLNRRGLQPSVSWVLGVERAIGR